jgi:hypothetical protein
MALTIAVSATKLLGVEQVRERVWICRYHESSPWDLGPLAELPWNNLSQIELFRSARHHLPRYHRLRQSSRGEDDDGSTYGARIWDHGISSWNF